MSRPDSERIELNEQTTQRLIQAALDGPTRPLRADEIEALTRRAAACRQGLPLAIPLGALAVLVAGVLCIPGLGWLGDWSWTGILQAALLIPLVNLALSPVAAYLIIKHRTHPSQQ